VVTEILIRDLNRIRIFYIEPITDIRVYKSWFDSQL